MVTVSKTGTKKLTKLSFTFPATLMISFENRLSRIRWENFNLVNISLVVAMHTPTFGRLLQNMGNYCYTSITSEGE
jgi:hypothetical protein